MMSQEHETVVSIEQFNPDSAMNSRPVDNTDIPVLTTRDLVLFPSVTMPISIGREATLQLVQKAEERKLAVAIACQRDPAVDYPEIPADLYEYAVIADIVKLIELPDGSKSVIVHARNRVRIIGQGRGEVLPGSASVAVEELPEEALDTDNPMQMEVVNLVKEATLEIVNKAGDMVPPELKFNIVNLDIPAMIVNLSACRAPIETPERAVMLGIDSMYERALVLLKHLNQCLEKAAIIDDIRQKTRENMSQQQRMAFMMSQLDTLQQEVYGEDSEIDGLKKRFAELNSDNEELKKTFDREIGRLSRINPQSPDYNVLYTYLETLLDLPWTKEREVNGDFALAQSRLDSSHSGLEKVKDRILEQIAVTINTSNRKSPIICLVGAPGVGKTSLGASIAAAMNRDFCRVSLGGLHDESEIRGHRRTYIGALPGRIMSSMLKAGSRNPVILLDEIDKISSDFRGDPQAALLEVLDPEQNRRFHDNYIDIDFDLSGVMFITTANSLSTISQPLLDRMEVIEISGYLPEEKIEIARNHSIPRLLCELGMENRNIRFTNEAIKAIIEGYTAESGVRQLENKIATVLRRLLLKSMRGKRTVSVIKPSTVTELLGVRRYSPDRYEAPEMPGVVTGLAWTSVGGTILFIEASLMPAKESRLTLTGSLGDVMKESAMIAHQYIKAHAGEFGIDRETIDNNAVHIHVPEGATPKDGPSAGITMLTALVSAYTGRPARRNLAMTGELTLRGRVLPVGGIKEKILAAKRAGVTTIIMSEDNRKDVEEIKSNYLEGLSFNYVKTAPEVISLALDEIR